MRGNNPNPSIVIPRLIGGRIDASQAGAASARALGVPRVGEQHRLKDSTKMLLALSNTHRHFYEGTVPAATVGRRRAKNRAARHARRASRR